MDQAGKFTAEHTVMEAGIEIRELKHLLKVAEERAESYLKENKQLINDNKELRDKLAKAEKPQGLEVTGADTVTMVDGNKIQVGFAADSDMSFTIPSDDISETIEFSDKDGEQLSFNFEHNKE